MVFLQPQLFSVDDDRSLNVARVTLKSVARHLILDLFLLRLAVEHIVFN